MSLLNEETVRRFCRIRTDGGAYNHSFKSRYQIHKDSWLCQYGSITYWHTDIRYVGISVDTKKGVEEKKKGRKGGEWEWSRQRWRSFIGWWQWVTGGVRWISGERIASRNGCIWISDLVLLVVMSSCLSEPSYYYPVAFIWLNWLSFLMLARGGVFARLTIYTSCITLWSFHNDVRWSSDMWPTKQLPYFSLGYVTTIFSYQVPGRISRPRNMLLKFSTSFPLL